MLKQELLDNIKENALQNRTEILNNATAKAHAVLDETTKSSEELKNQARLKVQTEAELIRERQFNFVRFQANARRYELKSSAIEEIWCEIEEILRKIEQSDGYKNILETLFFECVSMAPDGSVVRAFPADAEIVKACIDRSKRQLVFEEDPQVHGGVELHWPDGKTVLKNTLLLRLSRLKAEGNAEISRILFSSEEESMS